MAPAPTVGAGFFPLDEELALPMSGLTPQAHHALVLLGTLAPFARAAEYLDTLLQVRVSASTVRRLSEQASRWLEAWQDEHAQPLSEAVQEPEETAEQLVMATDGVLIPVLPADWAEVKMTTLALVCDGQDAEAQCEELSYFARLADAATFADRASFELRRRGVAQAHKGAAVSDGAEWIVDFVQGHRADAVRILDFAHAAQYLAQIGQMAQEAGVPLAPSWREEQWHALKHEGPSAVLKEVQRLHTLAPSQQMSEKVSYLCKREGQMQYPQYQADGWPIGSGMAESGNKLVLQARLKGAGMHWDRRRVNGMLVLRTTLCSHRWTRDWHVIPTAWHTCRRARFRTRAQAALGRAVARLQHTFLSFPLPFVLACFPSPPPPPAGAKGRTEVQKRWGRQTFSQRAIQDGRYAKK